MVNNKIREYGDRLGISMNSEDVIGITHPVDYQCSYIDSIIREIESAQDSVGEADYSISWEELGSASMHVDNINKCLNGRVNDLEEIRQSFIQLRQWGEEWKMIAKWLIEKSDVSVKDVVEYVKDNKEQ